MWFSNSEEISIERTFYGQFGQGSTFPQVVLNDTQKIGGCTETVKYLRGKQTGVMENNFCEVYDDVEKAIDYAFRWQIRFKLLRVSKSS